MKAFLLIGVVACVLAVSAPARVAAAPKKSGTIEVTLSGLGCSAGAAADSFNARSWSWGAENTSDGTSGGGSGSGKSQVSQLSLTRGSDACSPALLGAVMTGRRYTALSLSQYDSGGVLTATVVLNNVTVTNWQIGGSNAAAEATEEVRVAFSKFTFTDVASGNKFCYDSGEGGGC